MGLVGHTQLPMSVHSIMAVVIPCLVALACAVQQGIDAGRAQRWSACSLTFC
jgi:hypothetical protein